MYSEAISDIFDRDVMTKDKFLAEDIEWFFPIPFVAHVYLRLAINRFINPSFVHLHARQQYLYVLVLIASLGNFK